MRLIRRIIAVTLALSVALLPTAGSAGLVVDSKAPVASDSISGHMMPHSMMSGMSVHMMSGHMAMASDASAMMPDCCPDQGNTDPNGHPGQPCPMAYCGTILISMAEPRAPHFDLPVPARLALAIPVDQVVSAHSGAPPFRPPRI
jgi:hypothetical protein